MGEIVVANDVLSQRPGIVKAASNSAAASAGEATEKRKATG
jgi:hypothetical protein